MGEDFGSTLADYEIIEPLGRGAYSYVYRVRNRLDHQEYGLKVIDKTQLKRNVQVKRLMNEIQIQSSLSHLNIVKMYHHFEDEASYYLVLEFCPGGELFHHIKSEGRLKEPAAALLCGQLVEGLMYMHSHHIIHRDLKLGNLLLNEEATVLKIADFGLAKQLESLDSESETVCGTPNYISPEIANRQPHGLPSDLWALGCIIYACLSGHPPFESPTVGGTLSNIKSMALEMPAFFSPEATSLITSLLVWEKRDRMTIQQVREHCFFRGFMEDTLRTSQNKSVFTLDSDCSFFEYRETFSSPKTAAKPPPARASVPKLCLTHRDEPRVSSTPRSRRDISVTRPRGSKSLHHDSSVTLETGKLAPLSTEHLSPIKHKTKNGFVEITAAKWVVVEAGSRRIDISSDGLVVMYKGKKVPLSALNPSAVKMYEYAKDFIHAVESKTPKVRHKDEVAEYLLMWNNPPYQNFEAVFRTGERAMYQVGSEKMTIRMPTGEEVTLNPHQKPLQQQHIHHLAEKVLEGLVACFRLEKEMDAKA